jgi:hypothetical protein
LKEKLKPSSTRKNKEFVTTKPALQKILKGFLHMEEETKVETGRLKKE